MFFKDMDEKRLYDFFIKATLLEVTRKYYHEADCDFTTARGNIEEFENKMIEQRKERDEWISKVAKARAILKDEERRNEYAAEYKWYKVQEKEGEKAQLEEEVKKQVEEVKTLAEQSNKVKEEVEKAEENADVAKAAYTEASEKLELAQKHHSAAKDAYKEASDEAKDAKAEIDKMEGNCMQKDHEKRLLANEARKMRVRKKDLEKQREKALEIAKRKKQALSEKQDLLQSESEDLVKKKEVLTEEFRQARDEMVALKSEQERRRKEREDLQREKLGLERAGNSSEAQHLARFGSTVMALAKQVEEHWKKGGYFEKKPVGPVGRHVKLVGRAAEPGSELPDLLQAEMGVRSLAAFLVDNDRDRKQLEKLSRGIFTRSRPPMVSIMRLGGRRNDISRGKVATSPDSPGMLDYLSFSNEDAFNFVVEECRVEKTLVVTQEKAQVGVLLKPLLKLYCTYA